MNPLEIKRIVFTDFMFSILTAKISRRRSVNVGNYQGLNAYCIHQLTEACDIYAQVACQVFMRNELQDVRASLQELFKLLLRSKGLQFRQPFQ